MSVSSSESLCTQCGLCCGGGMFADVELKGEQEATSMEAMGVEVDEESGRYYLIQPCNALRNNKCTVYEHRPECCRTFECQLLKAFHAGTMTMKKALKIISDVRLKLKESDPEAARQLIEKQFLNWK